jgi:hypothetical protein
MLCGISFESTPLQAYMRCELSKGKLEAYIRVLCVLGKKLNALAV